MKQAEHAITGIDTREALDVFYARAKTAPLLSAEEEASLLRRVIESNDNAAREKLVKSHFRLVASVARKYKAFDIHEMDLIAEGCIGLVVGLEKFQFGHNARFATYALWWIKAYIRNYIISNMSQVRVPNTQKRRTVFYRIAYEHARGTVRDDQFISYGDAHRIANDLNVGIGDVLEMQARMFGGGDVSLQTPLGENSETTMQDVLAADVPAADEVLEKSEREMRGNELIAQGLSRLTEREKYIFTQRRLKEPPLTLQQLSEELGVTRQRIQQIEFKAEGKFATYIRSIMSRSPFSGAA